MLTVFQKHQKLSVTALLSSLLELQNRSTAPVWQKAEKLFNDMVVELRQVKGYLNGSDVPAARP